jgi:segregation and condensation protein B
VVARARKLSEGQVKNVVESVLFVAPSALTLDQLFEATGIDREKISRALGVLQGERREGLAGIVLHEVAGGWQYRTAPESAEFVRRFLKVKPQRLTRAAVETLSIIAYRQPVTRPELEDIRGVDSGAVLKALLDRRLIKIVGKKEEVGRPILYGTTREFLEFFALKRSQRAAHAARVPRAHRRAPGDRREGGATPDRRRHRRVAGRSHVPGARRRAGEGL